MTKTSKASKTSKTPTTPDWLAEANQRFMEKHANVVKAVSDAQKQVDTWGEKFEAVNEDIRPLLESGETDRETANEIAALRIQRDDLIAPRLRQARGQLERAEKALGKLEESRSPVHGAEEAWAHDPDPSKWETRIARLTVEKLRREKPEYEVYLALDQHAEPPADCGNLILVTPLFSGLVWGRRKVLLRGKDNEYDTSSDYAAFLEELDPRIERVDSSTTLEANEAEVLAPTGFAHGAVRLRAYRPKPEPMLTESDLASLSMRDQAFEWLRDQAGQITTNNRGEPTLRYRTDDHPYEEVQKALNVATSQNFVWKVAFPQEDVPGHDYTHKWPA